MYVCIYFILQINKIKYSSLKYFKKFNFITLVLLMELDPYKIIASIIYKALNILKLYII